MKNEPEITVGKIHANHRSKSFVVVILRPDATTALSALGLNAASANVARKRMSGGQDVLDDVNFFRKRLRHSTERVGNNCIGNLDSML